MRPDASGPKTRLSGRRRASAAASAARRRGRPRPRRPRARSCRRRRRSPTPPRRRLAARARPVEHVPRAVGERPRLRLDRARAAGSTSHSVRRPMFFMARQAAATLAGARRPHEHDLDAREVHGPASLRPSRYNRGHEPPRRASPLGEAPPPPSPPASRALLSALVARRLGRPDGRPRPPGLVLLSGGPRRRPRRTTAPRRQWRGIYYRGDKIGFSVGQTTPDRDGYEMREDGRLQMTLLGSDIAGAPAQPARRSTGPSTSAPSRSPSTPAPARPRSAGTLEGTRLDAHHPHALGRAPRDAGARRAARALPEPPARARRARAPGRARRCRSRSSTPRRCATPR